jgi:hypothetical protein
MVWIVDERGIRTNDVYVHAFDRTGEVLHAERFEFSGVFVVYFRKRVGLFNGEHEYYFDLDSETTMSLCVQLENGNLLMDFTVHPIDRQLRVYDPFEDEFHLTGYNNVFDLALFRDNHLIVIGPRERAVFTCSPDCRTIERLCGVPELVSPFAILENATVMCRNEYDEIVVYEIRAIQNHANVAVPVQGTELAYVQSPNFRMTTFSIKSFRVSTDGSRFAFINMVYLGDDIHYEVVCMDSKFNELWENYIGDTTVLSVDFTGNRLGVYTDEPFYDDGEIVDDVNRILFNEDFTNGDVTEMYGEHMDYVIIE